MKRINYFSLAILAISLFAFGACSEIEKASVITVPVGDFTVDIPAVIEPTLSPSTLKADDGFKPFFGSATLNMMTDDNFAELAKYLNYQDMINSIALGMANIKITAETGTIAKDITISAAGVTPNFTLNSYTFGTTYSSPELTAYASKIFTQFVKTGNIAISIAGSTDVDDATNTLEIQIFFGSIAVKAQLIKL